MGERLVRVEVEGLRDVRTAMKKLESESGTVLRQIMKGAGEIVVRRLRTMVPRKTSRAVNSYKAKGQTAGAQIAFGGGSGKNSAAYVPWLDFGGSTGKGHRPGVTNSGSVYRTYLGRPVGYGRYLYPAIEAELPEVQDHVVEGLTWALRQFGMTIEGRD